VVKGSTEGSREHWRERNTGGKREYWRKEGVLKRVGSSGGSRGGRGGPGKVYCLRRKKRVKRLIKINNQLSCTVYCTN